MKGKKGTHKSSKPVALKPSSKVGNLDDFINNEMKMLKGFKKDQPKKINRETESAKNRLKESMNKANLNEMSHSEKKEENPLNSTATKFEGFAKATKFTETSTSQKSNNNELKTSLSSSKMTNTKPEPFVINKFPEKKNEKTMEIIDSLNKEKKPSAAVDIKPGEVTLDLSKPEVKVGNEKKYEMKVNKKEDDEEIQEDYDDFVQDDEIKMINQQVEEEKPKKKPEPEIKPEPQEDVPAFDDGKEYNNAEDDVYSDKKSKRYITIRRLRELRDIVSLDSEYLDLFSLPYTKDDDKNDANNFTKKAMMDEVGTNTNKVPTKDAFTVMDNTFSDISMDAVDNVDKEKVNKDVTALTAAAKAKGDKIKVTTNGNYQPLTYSAYKFFIHIGPYLENVLLNNINKYILQSKGSTTELTGMSKLEKDFRFPPELIQYIFPQVDVKEVKMSFKKFLFFDTKPFQIAISVTLSPKNSSPLSSALPTSADESCSLILLYSIFKSEVEKIYFSFSPVVDMITVGESESILLAVREDGGISVYDLYNIFNNEMLYLNYENNCSITKSEGTSKPKTEMILPIITKQISSNKIKKIIKCITERNSDKLYYVYAMSTNSDLISFKLRESSVRSFTQLEEAMNTPDISYDISRQVSRVFNVDNKSVYVMDIKCIEGVNDKIFLLCNLGLCEIDIEGKESFTVIPIMSNELNANDITAFDVSDTGHILIAMNDNSVKILSHGDIIFSSTVDLGLTSSIDTATWSNIICKNSKGKLIRKSLLANFYLFDTKNDFIIFDLNQKVTTDIRKIKRKKELGVKKQLSRKNSIVAISSSLFTDYSNFILMSNGNNGTVELHKLSLRKQFYEESSIKKVNAKIEQKILSLN